jgi:hypothetical protein
MSILIERAIKQTPEVCNLIEQLNGVLDAAYEAHQRHGFSIKDTVEKLWRRRGLSTPGRESRLRSRLSIINSSRIWGASSSANWRIVISVPN